MNPTTVIIFGGSSGIGEAAATRFIEKWPARLIVGRDQDRLERLEIMLLLV